MTLTLAEVEHIAELAKLALTDDEKARFQQQLSAILDYAAKLNAVNTDDIPPTTFALPLETVLREDAPRPGSPAKSLLANTADSSDAMFRVQAVMEEE